MTFGPRQREREGWNRFSKSIDSKRLLTHRVENICGNGTPDVVMINGYAATIWVENKSLKAWPKRPTTAPLKHSFEPGQLSWAREWKHKRGNCFVLLTVEDKEYYLLDPAWRIEEKTREELLELASATGREAIIEYLSELRNKAV